jgi:predicted nucleic acid-binding protein
MATWFLDTGFVIALISPRDRLHTAALRLSKDIETNAMRLVTSEAIVLEIGAALSKLSFRSAAMQIIESMRADANIEVVPLTDGLLQRAFQLFKSRRQRMESR